MNTTIKVEGMTCNHCKMNVEKGIKNVPGVKDANANINTGKVMVEGENIDFAKIKNAVNDLGYNYVD